jgi:hypothetical protein
MTNFTEHVEQYLGKIQHGWTKSSTGTSMPFQVAACGGGVVKDVTAFVTLGLSRAGLASVISNKLIRQELLMTVRSDCDVGGIPSLLQQIGSEALKKGVAYLRGDVIGPRGPLFNGSSLQAVYVTMPVYYPESFAVYKEPDGSSKVIAWLVPITLAEVEYIRRHGWSEFENLLAQRNPDLLNPRRSSMF